MTRTNDYVELTPDEGWAAATFIVLVERNFTPRRAATIVRRTHPGLATEFYGWMRDNLRPDCGAE